MSKPRQFWCDQSGTLDNGKVLRFEAHQQKPKCWEADKFKSFHLIEFSAYQYAIEELKAARETLLLYASGTPWIDNVGGERYAASERVERIDKFLKEIE